MDITTKPAVYLLTNTINGKIYIGKTFNLKVRIQGHRNSINLQRKSLIVKAIKKYGFENFDISILESFEEINDPLLLDREEYYIKLFDATNLEIGYNILTRGSDHTGRIVSEETRKKISENNKKRTDWKYGKDHHSYGTKHSEETKRKISKSHMGIKGYPVKQIDPITNEVIKIWPSVNQALKYLGRNGAGDRIIKLCKSGNLDSKSIGYKWSFA